MGISKEKYRVACGAILGATLLAYIPLFAMTNSGMLIHNLIVYLLPVLFLERELLFGFAYFLIGERRGKVKTLTKGLRLLFAIGAFVLAAIWEIRMWLQQYGGAEILAQVICVLGMCALVDSLADIFYYRNRETEKSFIKVLLLTGKIVYSVLVIQLSFYGWLLIGLDH